MQLKEQDLVSIIVPAFNAEFEIEECIQKLLQQTYSNIEVIVVDDGSTDKTLELCNSIKKRNNKIFVMHQQNAGVSAARNTGIKVAQGKWIVFIDADDYMHPMAIEKAILAARENSCDTVCWNCEGFTNNDEKIEFPSFKLPHDNIFYKSQVYKLREALYYTYNERYLYCGQMFRAVWGKLLMSDIIKTQSIQFPEGITIGEDAIFLLDYFSHVEKVLFINEKWNRYRISPQSAVGKYKENIEELQNYERIELKKRMQSFPQNDIATILVNCCIQEDRQYVSNLKKKEKNILILFLATWRYFRKRKTYISDKVNIKKIKKKSFPHCFAIKRKLYLLEAIWTILILNKKRFR